MTRLADATSAEIAGARLVLVPVGSVEQHGPHLPIDTDTVIAVAVARGVAAELGAWVAPPISYGSSGEHQSYAGTSSVGTEALTHLAVELTRSMRTWAERVVLVNAHGGNVAGLTASGRDRVGAVPDGVGRPARGFHRDLADAAPASRLGAPRPRRGRQHPAVERDPPAMMAGGVAAVSPNGVLGDPAARERRRGERVLKAMVAEIVEDPCRERGGREPGVARVALVTGAAGGIGSATVARLVSDGYAVVGVDPPQGVTSGDHGTRPGRPRPRRRARPGGPSTVRWRSPSSGGAGSTPAVAAAAVIAGGGRCGRRGRRAGRAAGRGRAGSGTPRPPPYPSCSPARARRLPVRRRRLRGREPRDLPPAAYTTAKHAVVGLVRASRPTWSAPA